MADAAAGDEPALDTTEAHDIAVMPTVRAVRARTAATTALSNAISDCHVIVQGAGGHCLPEGPSIRHGRTADGLDGAARASGEPHGGEEGEEVASALPGERLPISRPRAGERRGDVRGLHRPELLGFNASPLTFVASPGYTVVGDTAGRLTHALRIGGEVQARISSGFALMPEASFLHDVYGPMWL